MNFTLFQDTVDVLINYFKQLPEIEKVKIYGSRAKGNFEKGSDIDFAIYNHSEKDLTGKILSELD